jgi:hypothetical protein
MPHFSKVEMGATGIVHDHRFAQVETAKGSAGRGSSVVRQDKAAGKQAQNATIWRGICKDRPSWADLGAMPVQVVCTSKQGDSCTMRRLRRVEEVDVFQQRPETFGVSPSTPGKVGQANPRGPVPRPCHHAQQAAKQVGGPAAFDGKNRESKRVRGHARTEP